MTIRTNLKAGGLSRNHNETLRGGLTLRTGVKAGGMSRNHNETMNGGLTLRTNVKAGGLTRNHNETLRGGLKLRTNVKAGGLSRNHNEALRSGLTLRTNVKAGGIGINHNETLREGLKQRTRARGFTRRALELTAGLVTTAVLASPAHAQRTAVLSFTCDLGGAPAQLTMQVEVVIGGGGFLDRPGVVIPGEEVNYFYQGTLISATGRYSFHGENDFADFVDHLTNDRFRVQFIARGQQLLMIINPQGPGPAQHLCQLSAGSR